MTFRVVHSSQYKYTTPAALSLNEACLQVRSTNFQAVLEQSLETEPAADFKRTRTDYFGNIWAHLAFEQPHFSLKIISTHRVTISRPWGELVGDGATSGFEPFLQSSPYVRIAKPFADYGRASFPAGRARGDGLVDLTERLFRDFVYDDEATEVSTPVEEFFRLRRGVCQDFSHLMLCIVRSLGHPARYVSGYLNTLPPPGKTKVWGADASHAWVAVWLPDLGWVEFDPTNGAVVRDQHITVAWGRDYGDVSPLKGVVLGGGAQTLEVQVTVLADD